VIKLRKIDAERDYLDIYRQHYGLSERDPLPGEGMSRGTGAEEVVYEHGSPCGGSFERLDGKWWWDGDAVCDGGDLERSDPAEVEGVVAIVDGNCYFEDAEGRVGSDALGEFACVEEGVLR
jgi:hypothetical protein